MADDLTLVSSGTGGIANGTVIATRDTGSGHSQKVDVAPWIRTVRASAQYGLSVTTGAAVSLTVPGSATHALISVDPGAANLRWRHDSTAPTTTAGHYVQAGDAFEVDNLAAVRLLGQGGTATVQVTYYSYD